MAGGALQMSVACECVGCRRARNLDQLNKRSERCIASAPGVQVHLVDEEVKCPACGDRRVMVRWSFGKR